MWLTPSVQIKGTSLVRSGRPADKAALKGRALLHLEHHPRAAEVDLVARAQLDAARAAARQLDEPAVAQDARAVAAVIVEEPVVGGRRETDVRLRPPSTTTSCAGREAAVVVSGGASSAPAGARLARERTSAPPDGALAPFRPFVGDAEQRALPVRPRLPRHLHRHLDAADAFAACLVQPFADRDGKTRLSEELPIIDALYASTVTLSVAAPAAAVAAVARHTTVVLAVV